MVHRRRKLSVIISGMPSVGKTTAAEAIAKKFGLRHLAGGDMLKDIAIEGGYKPSGSDWWDSEQGMAFLSERKNNAEFDKEVDRRLVRKLKLGNVVITSYPLPWITDVGLKLWFEASVKTRAKRLAGRDSISVAKALKIINQRDSKNRKLYKQIYGISFGKDMMPFHYIVDTEKLGASEVANISCRIVTEYLNASRKSRNVK